jgi:predicted nucleic acid-binding protein
MGVFVDTGVFVAVRNRKGRNHPRAKDLMRSVIIAEFRIIDTSDSL